MSSKHDFSRTIRLLISQAKTLRKCIEMSLSDTSIDPHTRFVSFKNYAQNYNFIKQRVEEEFNLKENSFTLFLTDDMSTYVDTPWPIQKEIMESVYMYTGDLLNFLENESEFADDEFDTIENFLKSKLRSVIHSTPQKEVEIQNSIESLFIGKGMEKGLDYDRETGKFEFSGKEYIPDFVMPKLNLCVEVKLLKDGRKSKIIEEVNADITAYSKKYDRQIYVVYDLGVIRDEVEFKRDIENAGENIKVIVVKH